MTITLSPTTQLSPKVVNLYSSSFPISEQRPENQIAALLSQRSPYTLFEIEWDQRFAGFISIWNLGSFHYVEHFAIDTAFRGQGVGSATLEQLKKLISTPIVLEVEPPTNTTSQKRIAFYNRSGFILYPSVYIQPPYTSTGAEVELRLMSYPAIGSHEAFTQIEAQIKSKVYKGSGSPSEA